MLIMRPNPIGTFVKSRMLCSVSSRFEGTQRIPRRVRVKHWGGVGDSVAVD